MLKRLVLCAVLVSCLGGCVAAFMAGAAAGGYVVFDRRTLLQIKEDNELRFKIHDEIAHNPDFKGSHIVVSSFHRVILLAGQAQNEQIRSQTETIVHRYPQVAKLYNQITIGAPTSNLVMSSDAIITGEIKTKMLTVKGLQTSQIKVVTENGVVYLMGKVSSAQKQTAINIARSTSGVQSVVTLFSEP